MKRARNIMEHVIAMDNLYLAFWKARKGKDGWAYVEQYRQNLDENLHSLLEGILIGRVKVGSYHTFKIYDPKERMICAAAFPERVLHHALMRVCHPVFEQYQVYDSYATRPGKGTHRALQRAQQFQKKFTWFLKLDVRKFFDSIDQGVLIAQLERRFAEKKLIRVFEAILDTYAITPGKGLPIGNLTSQYFANHYLAAADHYVKEALRVKGYVRYMDDMVLWGHDKKMLLEAGNKLKTYIEEKLLLDIKPFCLNRTALGLPFLGYVVFPQRMSLQLQARRRFRSKMKKYWQHVCSGFWSESEYYRHITPLLVFARQGDTLHFRRQCVTPQMMQGC